MEEGSWPQRHRKHRLHELRYRDCTKRDLDGGAEHDTIMTYKDVTT